MAPKDELLSECLRQQKPDESEEVEEQTAWRDKFLHGVYHRQIEKVADIKTYQWLENAGLTDSTEALIIAAQEQALSKRAREARVYHSRSDPRCRLCKDASETVQHIVAGCTMQAGSAYMERHNQVPGIVYRNICTQYRLKVPKSQWDTPPKVDENNRAEILWDFSFQTDKQLLANLPDIVVVDKYQERAVVVDVAIPANSNISKKEHEKVEKYQWLKEQLGQMWKVKVDVVPVVVGALGAVTPKLGEWLWQIPGTTSEASVQKCAVLETAKILCRILKLRGLW
ncbi:uncharacterized protein LOC144458442 [Epinephelus lanceolatus]